MRISLSIPTYKLVTTTDNVVSKHVVMRRRKDWGTIKLYNRYGITNDMNDTNTQRPCTDIRYLDIENSTKRLSTNTLTNSDKAIVMIHAQKTASGEPPISRNK